jgi:pyruvate dehydrogenase (quinone)
VRNHRQSASTANAPKPELQPVEPLAPVRASRCGVYSFPKRQVVAIAGDGGLAQLRAELTAAVKYELPMKVLVLKNNSLAEVLFEQKELGNPVYGCDLAPIDFAGFGQACGAEGYAVSSVNELDATLEAFLRSQRPAVLEALVDANEKPTLPQDLA